MLSVNRMLNTKQGHQYDETPLYSSPSCHSLPQSSLPLQRSSMLDIANLLCRDEDEDDTRSQLTTPCLSVTSSPMASHTKLNPPSFINLSNLDHPPHFHQSQFECNDDHLSTTSITSPLTPPLRSSPYYHQSSLSTDTLLSNSKKVTTEYHYQHRLVFTTDPTNMTTSSNSDNRHSDSRNNEDDDNNNSNNSNNSSNGIKAKRRRATSKQLQVLQSVFEHTFFPSTLVRSQLGRQLGMSPRTVQIWFQNRRQALRTKEKRSSNGLL